MKETTWQYAKEGTTGAIVVAISMTEVTRCPHLEPISVCGSMVLPFSVYGFSALHAEKPYTNKSNVPLCRRQKQPTA
jgi:hypothetical protein